ncbi:hypothetical protein C8J56DRAFT_847383 [Mycena floridula]|nr:hypothetical protein C8J56DRAFT_847383 [Mycena floridula]
MADTIRTRFSPSDPNFTVLVDRADRRAKRLEEKKQKATELKEKGNELYKNKNFQAAADIYIEALTSFGPDAVIFNNLTAAYLAMKSFDSAEAAATEALGLQPSLLKARYRRGVARKGKGHLKGAIIDLDIVLQNDESCEPAAQILREVFAEMNNDDDDEEEPQPKIPADFDYDTDECIWPAHDDSPYVSDAELSDSSDCDHLGNGFPCRFYNHEGCKQGDNCKYSHAPDDKSIRDGLGKNVCFYFLIDSCKFGSIKCAYSHDKTYLPEPFWWQDTVLVAGIREITLLAMAERREERRLINNLLRGISDADVPGSSHSRTGRNKKRKTKKSKQPPATKTDSPFLLKLSLDYWEDEFSGVSPHFLAAAKSKLRVVDCHDSSAALKYLSSPDLTAVFVTDPGISLAKNSTVLSKLIRFTKAGGNVVIGGRFSGSISFGEFDRFFKRWNLPWLMGSYHSDPFCLNPQNETVKLNPSLCPSMHIKTVHLKNVNPVHGVYKAENPGPDEYPIVHAPYENGRIGFIGEINADPLTTPAILAMLGLLDHSYLNPQLNKSPSPVSNKFILLISLEHESFFDSIHAHLLEALRAKILIVQVFKPMDAVVPLFSSDLAGVFITDPGMAHCVRREQAIDEVVNYTKKGGRTVIGGLFSSFIRPAAMEQYFSRVWKLNWKMGSYSRETFPANPNHEIIKAKSSALAKSYSMKAVNIQGAPAAGAMYKLNDRETPVLQVKIGDGYLGYIGDVNAEQESTNVILAMLGLL